MKNSYYFPHDYHARHDPKLERLRMEVGPIGDGIYWDLIEILYEEGGQLPLKHLPLIAKTLNTTIELVTKVVKSSELFSINGDKFYSKSLLERLKRINARRRRAISSANKRWKAKAMPTHSEGNAIKESKVKESKESKESKVKESRVKRREDTNAQPSDIDFIKKLKANPAYQHINIDNELNKMDAWLLVHKDRQKTRRFIVGWLNKIDKPIDTTPKHIPRPDPKCDICKGKGRILEGALKGAICLCVK